jgi:hypothetical protein
MRRTTRDHENFNVEHQHRIGGPKIKDSMQNTNTKQEDKDQGFNAKLQSIKNDN